MNTILLTHPACIDHDTGLGHPECADRLRVVLRALEDESFMFLDRRIAPTATVEQIARVHKPGYAERVLGEIPSFGHVQFDQDTIVCPKSGEAALRAAGAVAAAVDAVIAGEAHNAFCAVRPPGHHAEIDRAMGFCLFNNAAIGAAHARKAHGLSRVAVIDFDVHHGNGTEQMFAEDAGLFYASIHQSPLYPFTGPASMRGSHDNIVNVPLPARSGSPEFRLAVQEQVLPALEAYAPELVIISAGFDAHRRDPLAGLELVEDDFVWITRHLCEIAARTAKGRVVSTLEGGYDLAALASSAAAHVRELMHH